MERELISLMQYSMKYSIKKTGVSYEHQEQKDESIHFQLASLLSGLIFQPCIPASSTASKALGSSNNEVLDQFY